MHGVHVILSAAMSVDGHIDDASPGRLILSNEADLDRVDALRASCDAILVGAGTLRADDPRLVIRSEERRRARAARGAPRHPMKITLTRSGRLSRDLAFFTSGEGERLVFCPAPAAPRLEQELGARAQVVRGGQTDVEVHALLAELRARGVQRLLIEGGTATSTLFLCAGAVDELVIAVAPFFVGEAAAPRLVSSGRFPFGKGRRMTLRAVERVGDMAVMSYDLRRDDHDWLLRAIDLSRKCLPSEGAFSVGCVIVDEGGCEVASGYSREGGAHLHAEEVALERALSQGVDLSGATLYSSLEPCSTRLSGRRSCTSRIIEAKIRKVVFALHEPAVFVRSEGEAELVRNGVEVAVLPELGREVEELNRHLL